MKPKTTTIIVLMILTSVQVGSAQVGDQPPEKAALIRSLILPGWGQQLFGDRRSARTFLLAEASLWLSYAVTRSAEGWYRQDYLAYAALHAGIRARDKPDIYYVRVGRYQSISEYNQVQLRRRNLDAVYPLGTDLVWNWDLPAHRERYNQLRRASLRADKMSSFILGSMVVNRAVSVIHVLFLSRSERSPSAAWTFLPDGGVLRIEFPI